MGCLHDINNHVIGKNAVPYWVCYVPVRLLRRVYQVPVQITEVFYICFMRQSNICPKWDLWNICFLHIKTHCFPKCPLFGDGCLNSAKGVPVPTAIWYYYIVHTLPDIDSNYHLYNQRPVLKIKSTGLSVCSMCWAWLKIYILFKRMCVPNRYVLDTYKPNLYWYSVVYCG